MKKLLSHDPETGVSKTFLYDPSVDAKNVVILTSQNVDSILEANKRAYASSAALGNSGRENFRKVASIPVTVLMDLRARGITKDAAAFKRWLNDPDNRLFRTAPGVV